MVNSQKTRENRDDTISPDEITRREFNKIFLAHIVSLFSIPVWLEEILGQQHKNSKSEKKLVLLEGPQRRQIIKNMLGQFIPDGHGGYADLEYMRLDLYEKSLEIEETAREQTERLPPINRWSTDQAKTTYFSATKAIDLNKRAGLEKIVKAFAQELKQARISRTKLKGLYEVDTRPQVPANSFRPDRLVTIHGEKVIDYTHIEWYMEDENFNILMKKLGLERTTVNQKTAYLLNGKEIDATSFLIRACVIDFLNRLGFDPPLTAKQYTTLYHFFLEKGWIPMTVSSVNMCPGPISIQYYNCQIGKQRSVVISCMSGSECTGVPRSFEDYDISLKRNQKNQE